MEDTLTVNQRNCILYRKSEKFVLAFLKDCANRVCQLSSITAPDAKLEIKTWKDDGIDKAINYFQNKVIPLLK